VPPTSEIMLATVWRMGDYRCEFWKAPGRTGHARLYFGSALLNERVATIDEVRSVADGWRIRQGAQGVRPRLDRRRPSDRRSRPRSGRRGTDPVPTCLSCGLPIQYPHGSDADCIAALRLAIGLRRRSAHVTT
jgi:hypothetical protein